MVPAYSVGLDEGDDIEETLGKRQAKYHHSCRISLNNTKLERAEKRDYSAAPSEGRSKFARSSLEGRVYVCFICEKEVPASKRRQTMTVQINALNEI